MNNELISDTTVQELAVPIFDVSRMTLQDLFLAMANAGEFLSLEDREEYVDAIYFGRLASQHVFYMIWFNAVEGTYCILRSFVSLGASGKIEANGSGAVDVEGLTLKRARDVLAVLKHCSS